MTADTLLFLAFHTPRQVRLPHGPIASGASQQEVRAAFFDEEAREQWFQRWLEDVGAPYADALRATAALGIRLHVAVAADLLEAIHQSKHGSAVAFQAALRQPEVSVLCCDPRHSLSIYLGPDVFRQEMERARQACQRHIGVAPALAISSHMLMNGEIYHALGDLGFGGVIADGTADLLAGRSPYYLRRNGSGPFLCLRDSAACLRLLASANGHADLPYALGNIDVLGARTAPGGLRVLGWEVPTTGSSGNGAEATLLRQIAEGLAAEGASFPTFDQVVFTHGDEASALPLPTLPAIAAEYGHLFFFLEHPVQRELFALMRQAHTAAVLTRDRFMIETALALAQWDILELLHSLLVSNGTRQPMRYLPPETWQVLGTDGVVNELRRLFIDFIDFASTR